MLRHQVIQSVHRFSQVIVGLYEMRKLSGNAKIGGCRFILTACCAALLLLTLTGCTSFRDWKANGFKVGPNYCKPGAEVETQWIDFQRDSRVSADEPDLSAWWTNLNDPVLNELVHQAYSQNLTLKQAGTAIMRARAIRGVAAGNLFPQVQQAVGSYSRIQASQNTAIPSPLRRFDDWAGGINAAWELDFWGRFRRSVAAADAELDASVDNFDDVLVILVADVARNYVQLRTFQQRLEITRSNLESQRGSLKIAEAQFLGEATNKLSVNQAANNIASTEALIPVFENGLRRANNRLCILLGIPPRDLVSELPPMPIPTVSPEVKVGIPADLLRRRPDIRAAERAVAAQSERIGIATAELYPRIQLIGSLEWQAGNLENLFEPASVFALISPGFTWNVLNYGRIKNSIEAQRAFFKDLVYQYQERVLVAQQEVDDSINSFVKFQDENASLREAVKEIVEAKSIATTLFETGAVNFNTVYLIEIFQLAQQDRLVVSDQNIALALIDIYRSLGGGWQIRCAPCVPAETEIPDAQEFTPTTIPLAPPADNSRLNRQLETIVNRLESIENQLQADRHKPEARTASDVDTSRDWIPPTANNIQSKPAAETKTVEDNDFEFQLK